MSIKLGLIKLIVEVHPHKELFEGLEKLKLYQYIYERQLRTKLIRYTLRGNRRSYLPNRCCPMVMAMKSQGRIINEVI